MQYLNDEIPLNFRCMTTNRSNMQNIYIHYVVDILFVIILKRFYNKKIARASLAPVNLSQIKTLASVKYHNINNFKKKKNKTLKIFPDIYNKCKYY